MRILVTGGAGFIASQIVDRYIELGHTVIVVDDLSTGKRQYLNPKAIFYEIDIRRRNLLVDVIRREKPEVLSHHAAQMEVRRSVADPVFDAEVNILGLLNLMEEGRINGLRQVIFASSGGAVYGDTDLLPTPETSRTQPASPYGVSKLASEHYLDFYFSTYGIRNVSLRYGNVYGPRQNPYGEAGVIAIFSQKLLEAKQPVINGDGQQTRDFIFIGDVVAANAMALKYPKSLKVNIGSGKGTDVNQIYKELTRLTQRSFPPKYAPPKPGEQRRSVLDNGLAKKTLGWQPMTELVQGLAQTVDYFRHEKKTQP